MSSTTMFYDPLTMNLEQQTRAFLETIPQDSPLHTTLLTAPTRAELLRQLSCALLLPEHTVSVALWFRPILLDLCARWLDDGADEENKFEALCLLLELHPELFPVLSALLRRPNLAHGPLGFVEQADSLHALDAISLQKILLGYYRILQANRQLPRTLNWPLSPLSRLIWEGYPDTGVRLLAVRCYALQARMMEGERVKLEKEVVGEVSEVDCPITYGCLSDGTRRMIDGWILSAVEKERVIDARNMHLSPQNYYTPHGDSIEPIHPAELSPLIANVHGVLMLRISRNATVESSLVSTPTSANALRILALHLSLRIPTLLTSPPSSGKSLLLSHLATVLFPDRPNQIVTIHLADTSLDPRSLLGSYVSSTTRPGTFDWKEGVLVRAMREGRWVVLEDIDRGSSEVLGLLRPLLESLGADKWIGARAVMEVPGRGRIEAHEDFSIFATRSLQPARTGKYPAPTFFGAHLLQEVVVEAPTHEDLRLILDTKFSRLAGPVAEGLIRLWEAVRALGSTASTRSVGMRELETLCVRVVKLLPSSFVRTKVDSPDDSAPELSSIFPNTALREDIFAECRDVFFGAGATTSAARAHLAVVSATIAGHLKLSPERRDWVLQGRVPELSIDKDVNGVVTSVRVGHTRLVPSSSSLDNTPLVTRPFAMHKPAISLLSRIATAVLLNEPILLTGETGTGKTSVVTHLASLLRKPLISLNLSNQTESSDIVGGFKPVDARVPASELQARFLDLFGGTFSRKKNAQFEVSVRKAVHEGKWKRAVVLWKESIRLAKEKIQAKSAEDRQDDAPRKRRKTDSGALNVPETNWIEFERDVQSFEIQHVQGNGKFAYGFVEGPLVKALRTGQWILLDEVNLASAETLECVSSLLHGPTASITLTEQGSLEPVPRHPDFRLFACMNPATDVGKKDLPPNIRSRFTEFDVPPPDADKETLLHIVTQYIGPYAVGDRGAVMDVAEFYAAVRTLAEKREIADGSNHRPHFSMRTLARALTFTADLAVTYSLRRALWEGCLMAFTMILDKQGAEVVTALAQKHILSGVRNQRSLLSMVPGVPHGRTAEEIVKFGPFYLDRGPLPEDMVEEFIMTPSVETKLTDLARILVTKRFPVLIEGPTSSGKTSSIEYLARRTGHRFVRINNHEHTDIQEYIGTYVSDPTTGKLVFKDGLLVRALRNGDWIVLDELNLAPTDVLEALNRLLDDNRELVIPETQEVVRPHPQFMLFATQNPPGLYAGRKVLSRAFRNRFLEVHFEDVPQAELETILCQRCRIAPSYASRIVLVFQELQRRRQSSRIFESKHGFATLRDLFRWAGRDAISYQGLADNGYMLLAERARRDEDKAIVKEVLESIMKVSIDPRRLYNLHGAADMPTYLGCPVPQTAQLIWTSAMQRLFTLVTRALRFNEPVLLVGETGCGKTSVCQLYAEIISKQLYTVNCHQNTETADLIGGLRPLRNRASLEAETMQKTKSLLASMGRSLLDEASVADATLLVDKLLCESSLSLQHRQFLEDIRTALSRLATMFEWHDGPLVEAMRNGAVFLMDEISLADDSVLERLNSVLEPSRTIVLAERGGAQELPAVLADETFKLVATMNPGGDYGKKELSPALRNRFTEIWVPAVDAKTDLELIVRSTWRHEALKEYSSSLLDFTQWLCLRVGDTSIASLRDILAWVEFSNAVYDPERPDALPGNAILHHAAHLTFLDGLGSLPQLSAYSRGALDRLKVEASAKLQDLAPLPDAYSDERINEHPSRVQFGPFSIPSGPSEANPHQFSFQAPTTRDNANRVVRACQLRKPILLEGSPGVGKTSLVSALANICGYQLCRINLSDQTDLIDLFGSDLPVEGGSPGQFVWKDAEFLRALQEGHWVLLDEMNLAPQAVLEGLNAVLDHRGTVYIPELGRTFTRHPSFRIFAAQNPLHQGGGRKGLPKSFLNRFTKVYVQELSSEDVLLVCRNLFPTIPEPWVHGMISYTTRLQEEVMVKRSFAREGTPWEFNLRDVIRWASQVHLAHNSAHPAEFIRTLFVQRFRNPIDQEAALQLFYSIFTELSPDFLEPPQITIAPTVLKVGRYVNHRSGCLLDKRVGGVLQSHLTAVESMSACLSNGWLTIITGPRSVGKSTLVRTMASLTGNALHEISINNSTDASDILGSFEEVDYSVRIRNLLRVVSQNLEEASALCLTSRALASRELQCTISTLLSPLEKTHEDILKASSHLLDALRSGLEVLMPRPEQLIASLTALTTAADGQGRFEWVDGPLVRALKDGSWVLLDGANLCNPSVLDRLNSLCEDNGKLTLNERGAVNGEVETVTPHPSFRIIMCVDSQFGELSRAMRNRGVEVALLPWKSEEDRKRQLEYLSLPTVYCDWPPLSTTSPFWYEAMRRGLASSSTARKPEDSIPSGTILVEDSIAASLLDLAPSFKTPSDSLAQSYALTFFILHSVPRSHLTFLIRLLCAIVDRLPHLNSLLPVLDGFLGSHALSVVNQFKLMWSEAQGFPSESILAQPIDPMASPETRNGSASAVVSLVRLFGHIHLFDLIAAEYTHTSVSSDVSSPAVQQRVLGEISALERTILAGVRHVVNTISIDEPQAEMHIVMCTKLLSYVRFIRNAAFKDIFDYSAAHVASQWLSECLSEPHPGFTAIDRHVRSLADVLSLTSGAGLPNIWVGMSHQTAGAQDSLKLRQLDAVAQRLPLTMQGLRRQVFELMALLALPMLPNDPNLPGLNTLIARLESQLPHLWSDVPEVSASAINPSYVTLELSLLSSMTLIRPLHLSNAFKNGVEELLQLSCNDTSNPLSRMISYQHAIWAHGADKLTPAHLVDMYKDWLESVWSISYSKNMKGPSLLLTPTVLRSTIAQCEQSEQTLDHLESYHAGLRRQLCLVVANGQRLSARSDLLMVLLAQCILMISSCFEDTYASEDYEAIQSIMQNTEGMSIVDALLAMLEGLQRTKHVVLRSAIKEILQPIFAKLRHACSPNDVGAVFGECWVAFGSFLLELYVPDTPIDPAGLKRCANDYWTNERSVVELQLHMHETFSRRTDANERNGTVRYLEGLLSSMPPQLSEHLTPNLPESRLDIARLHMFWSEVRQFLAQVLSRHKIDSYISVARAGDSTAVLREEVLQNSLSTFCQRLKTFYADFNDVSSPIQLALLSTRLGLRVLTHVQLNPTRMPGKETAMYGSLLAFPSVRSAELLRAHALGTATSPLSFAVVLARLSAISFEVQLDGDIQPYMHDVQQAYEQALGLWSIDQARQEEAEREAQSLYRRKDDGNLNEAEEEEQEFLSIFPEFEDVLDQDNTNGYQTETRKKHRPLVDSAAGSRLFDIHQELFLATDAEVAAASDRFLDDRRSLVNTLIESDVASWPDSLDGSSVAFQVRLLHDRISALDHAPRVSSRPYNFYFDANMSEVKKAIDVLRTLLQRLDALIGEWPDQMILQHLKARCEVVMNFSLHSPLAKLLSALEHLLSNIDDWEMYANRNNSLTTYQQAIISLVVDWRRLELSSWQGLLDSQAIAFESGTSEWWFRLYDAAIRGVLNAAGDSNCGPAEDVEIETFLDNLVPLLDDFVTSSPLGQFSSRLRLINSMRRYADQLSIYRGDHQDSILFRVHKILFNTATFYAQFEAKVQKSLTEQRKGLEKSIRDFIKLASWKDVNIHALKQSAQKTHRQLYKVIRKFRDVLRQPVAPLLEYGPSDSPGNKSHPIQLSQPLLSPAIMEPTFPAFPVGADQPAHLINLSRTFHNFDTLIRNRVLLFVNTHQPEAVESLSEDIIAVSKALSSVPIPTNVDAARRIKLAKNLLTRKRKAWSDFMKELKRAGFSANVKPEILQQNQSRRYLREQPYLPSATEKYPVAFKGEKYLHRVSSLLPLLRQALSDHHSDLSTRDLQRALMHIEHTFFVSLQTRFSLIALLGQLKDLEGIHQRLRAVRECPQIVCVGPKAHKTVTVVRNTAYRLNDALRDLVVYLQDLQGNPPSSAIPISLIDEITGLQPPLLSLGCKLNVIIDNLQACSYSLVLRDEYTAVRSAVEHFTQIAACLRKWSSDRSTLLSRFTLPVLSWLEDSLINIQLADEATALADKSAPRDDEVIDSLLVAVQTLLGICQTIQEGEEEDRDNYIRDDTHLIRRLSEKLSLNRVLTALHSLFEQFTFASPDNLRTTADRVLPFLERYHDLVNAQVATHASWTKALFKLSFTLCSIVRTVAKDGFCQPTDTEGTEDGGEGQETMQGAGLGEGTGDENVSKEIQDESQVEGLQGEDNANDEKVERAEEGNAIEMSEDFGGEMQDVPEEEDEGDEQSEDGSDVDPDEQVGNVDESDENAVDERLWGDEQGPEDKDNAGKTNQDHSKEQTGESEMVAKEEEQKPEKEQKSEKEADESQEQDQPMQDDMNESLPDEEPAGTDGAAIDEHIQEADTLNLPDEMEMDQEAQEQDPTGDVEDDLMDEGPDDEHTETGSVDDVEQTEVEDDVQDASNHAVQDDVEDAEGAEDTAVAQADTHAGDGMGSADTQAAGPQGTIPENAESVDQQDGSKGQQGQTAGLSQEQVELQDETTALSEQRDAENTEDPSRTEVADNSSAQDTAAGNKTGARTVSQGDTQRPSSTANPLRSLGDALREISQRFNEILEADPESSDQKPPADKKPGQVEYIQNDDTEDDLQALGPARQDEVAKLRELNIADDDDHDIEPVSMEVDNEVSSDHLHPDHSTLSSLEADATSDTLKAGVESILTSTDLNKSSDVGDPHALSPWTTDLVSKEEEEEDAELELEVRQWQAAGHSTDEAEHIWRRYESLTHDLSYALCEQLRLILEPTQATRLKGDYRTGKRLNMKKIIPYIASEYTKDKIWLRRTRPSQREYQVLIALDDSRSMAESHSIHLAFQTLALVSKALGRLEVGDVGIAKFGESIEILHGFESGPFSDQAGANIIDAFRFDQKATQVLTLLETSLSLLEQAREKRSSSSSTAADLWQMEIIISDGVCQDHERLRTVLRRAEEQRVMVVFIILDSLHSSTVPGSSAAANQNSIVSMNQVAYKDVNGRMDLTVTRYLDTFPFEYYVVVRDVEALPEVLSGTLKQFFERISEE